MYSNFLEINNATFIASDNNKVKIWDRTRHPGIRQYAFII